ncbi:MAG: sigma-70 family RNA polymerase sigma factor [Bacteroidetes bacterium]|nr:sigma-70 family RNA polymerase sigma factor [Bacteroidota bacterium]
MATLISALKNKQHIAYEYLYDNYSEALYGVIHKVLNDDEQANDILQDTIVTIWQKIDSYNPEKGTLFTWMLNIARNKAIDEFRKNKRNPKISIDELSVHTFDMQNVNNLEVNATDVIGLKKIVNGLKPDLRQMIDMHYFNGMTHQEITDATQMPLGTVKTKIRTAMMQLKSIFEIK